MRILMDIYNNDSFIENCFNRSHEVQYFNFSIHSVSVPSWSSITWTMVNIIYKTLWPQIETLQLRCPRSDTWPRWNGYAVTGGQHGPDTRDIIVTSRPAVECEKPSASEHHQ